MSTLIIFIIIFMSIVDAINIKPDTNHSKKDPPVKPPVIKPPIIKPPKVNKTINPIVPIVNNATNMPDMPIEMKTITIDSTPSDDEKEESPNTLQSHTFEVFDEEATHVINLSDSDEETQTKTKKRDKLTLIPKPTMDALQGLKKEDRKLYRMALLITTIISGIITSLGTTLLIVYSKTAKV